MEKKPRKSKSKSLSLTEISQVRVDAGFKEKRVKGIQMMTGVSQNRNGWKVGVTTMRKLEVSSHHTNFM